MDCELEDTFGRWGCIVSKRDLPRLPSCCVETWLGDPKCSLRQYRCPHGFHVREYDSWFELHKDVFDPRRSPLKHLLFDTDAPKFVVGLAALAVVRAVYG